MTAQLLHFPDGVRRPEPPPAPEPGPPPSATAYQITLRDQQVAVLFAGQYVTFNTLAELQAEVLRSAVPTLRTLRHTARAALAARLRSRRARRQANIVWALRIFVMIPALAASAGAVLFVALTGVVL